MLVGREIMKSFGKKEVLHGVSIEIGPGRITILMGPSGSGKTTLARALSLIDYPTSGSVCIDDRTHNFPLSGSNKKPAPWPDVTLAFQQHFLWPNLTIRENILLPATKRGYEMKEFDNLVQLFGMHELLDRYPNQVSQGQRQRAALLRAFMLKPKYIILDEITSALDVEQTSRILHHLLDLRERSIGLLVITHLIGFARRLVLHGGGDQVAFLDEGMIVEDGGPELFQSPQSKRFKEFLSAGDFAF